MKNKMVEVVKQFFTKDRIIMVMIMGVFTFVILASTSFNVCAWNGAEQAAKNITKELQWVGWAVLAVILIPILAKRNFISAAITGVIGAIMVILIGNPMALKSMGEWFATNIFGITL